MAPRRGNAIPLVVALLVVAALGVVGTIVGFASGGDDSTDTSELRSTIAALTAERDGLAAQVGDLDATLAGLRAERDGLAAQVGDLDATVAANAVERDQLLARVGGVESTIAAMTAERDGLIAQVAELETDLAAEVERADAASAERDSLAAMFPVEFDGNVVVDDLAGTFDAEYSMAYRQAFAAGAIDPPDEIVVRTTSEGYLVLEMDGFLDAGLFRIDGALVAVADTTSAVPACDGSPRVARVTVTLYPDDIVAASDGSVEISSLAASITVHAAATAGCPAGLAMFGAQLTPQP